MRHNRPLEIHTHCITIEMLQNYAALNITLSLQ